MAALRSMGIQARRRDYCKENHWIRCMRNAAWTGAKKNEVEQGMSNNCHIKPGEYIQKLKEHDMTISGEPKAAWRIHSEADIRIWQESCSMCFQMKYFGSGENPIIHKWWCWSACRWIGKEWNVGMNQVGRVERDELYKMWLNGTGK